MKLQGRFRHLLPEEIKKVQARVTEEYQKLREKADKTEVTK
jgi:hypothetical protein